MNNSRVKEALYWYEKIPSRRMKECSVHSEERVGIKDGRTEGSEGE